MTGSSTGRVAPARLAAALAGNYLYRAGAAALLALPVVGVLGGSGIRSFARGDARLFEPGGLYLLEVAVRSRELLAESLAPTALAVIALGAVGLVPEWWLVSALGSAAPAPRSLPRLFGLALATWGARLLLGLLTLGVALTARSFFASALDERLPLVAIASVAGLGLVLQAGLSLWRDLAEIELIAHGASPRDAVLAALARARTSSAGLVARYAATQVLGLGVLFGAAAAVGALDVARGEGWRGASAVSLHQLAVLASIALRAAWLWSARRALERGPAARAPRQAEAFL